MKINRHIVRGYDVRGVVDEDLNPEIVEHFGRAYGTYIQRRFDDMEKVVIGFDSRLTSEEYRDAMAKGIASTGLDVIDIGLTLVGTVYWAQYHFDTKGAVMITASHNPKEYNGFKMASDLSEAMIGAELEELVDLVEAEDYIEGEKEGEIKQIDVREEYFADIIERVEVGKKFKVVVDASCATAGTVIPDLLRRIDCEVIESNCEIDGNFPLGVADPTEVIVAERLRDKVLETGADIGLSYDTDGDRIGIVDEKGGIIWNDVLVAILALDILDDHPGEKIMYNTLCSKVVDEAILAKGGQPFMWRTGHGFLKKKNQEVKAPFIGELSGHFFFSADFYNHDDGCYVTLRLLSYLAKSGKTLSEAVAELPQYISSPEIKLYCADDKKVELMDKIAPLLSERFPDAEVIDDERAGDGVRLELEDGMFVIRYSQNGPYITIKFEGKTQERYDELKVYLNELLHSFEEIDWNNEIKVNADSLE